MAGNVGDVLALGRIELHGDANNINKGLFLFKSFSLFFYDIDRSGRWSNQSTLVIIVNV